MSAAQMHLNSLLTRLTLTRREARHWQAWAAEQDSAELTDAVAAVETALVAAEASANRALLAESEVASE